jgi:2-phosphosulfolactate phosphatase
MKQQLHVHMLPDHTTAESLRGATVVVIDVLRASTTITQALSAGAREVIPFLDVDQVHSRAGESARETIVLGGERGGLKIDQFDLGNSPGEYTPESVGGKTVLFTTTNGTKAMLHCLQAERVLIGSPSNVSAVAKEIESDQSVHLLCAGTHGKLTREDVLAAGAITYKLARDDEGPWQLDDGAQLARIAWRGVVAGAVGQGEPVSDRLAKELQQTHGGRNLIAIGHEHDLVTAAQVDQFSIVPELDLAQWRITVAPPR